MSPVIIRADCGFDFAKLPLILSRFYSTAAATALLAFSICFCCSAVKLVGARLISILLRVPVNLNGDW